MGAPDAVRVAQPVTGADPRERDGAWLRVSLTVKLLRAYGGCLGESRR